MYTTFIKYSNPEYTNVTRNNHDLLLDQSKPPSYNITVAQMNMMSLVQTTNQTITNPDAYFSGVYLQTYNINNVISFDAYEAVLCSQIYTEQVTPDYTNKVAPYMLCPNKLSDTFIQGTGILLNTPMSTDT